MKAKKMTFTTMVAIAITCCSVPAITSCAGSGKDSKENQSQTSELADKNQAMPGGPQLGDKGHGPVIDKSADAALQAMIKEVAPQFKVMEYKDSATGKTMKYNLYTPKNVAAGQKYPLVMFIADASTVGNNVSTPLTQGYGALVWATDQWQAKNPCYVLVPQFSGVAVNDNYDKTDEADIAMRLLNRVVANNSVDTNRLYSTGQSMGGMLSMYYDVAYPDMFAASIFVDSHWDKSKFESLVKHKFIYFIAGTEGKAYKCLEPLEDAARKVGVQYTFAEWSAQLPEARQSELAATMLAKGAPVNIFEFEPKSVLPADSKGSEHMYSFDYAYKIPSVKEWLFKQKK